MSDDTDTIFHIYHRGKFEVHGDTISSYVGGEIHKLLCKPETLFSNLMEALDVALYGKQLSYKLPYEDFSEIKKMSNGCDNYNRMCLASKWTKAVDVFVEDIDILGDAFNDADIGDGLRDDRDSGDGLRDDRGSGDGLRDDRDSGDGFREQREVSESERDVGEDNDDYVEALTEDDGDCDSEGTPPNSDCEEECERRYLRYKKGSGMIRLGQVFDTIPLFREAVVEYALKEGVNVKYNKWGSKKSSVICAAGSNCKFRIYCAIDKEINKYMVKTLNDVHSCIKDGFSKVLKDGIIARLFLNDIRKNLNYKPRDMQEKIEEKYNLTVTNDQCRKAKAKALKIIQAEEDEQFARIKDYRIELIESNPGSTVEVGTKIVDGVELFEKFYVCLAPIRKTWLAYCRPIFGIDGCFLKNNVKGQLLAAIGRDANNQFFPIAWSVVDVENTENWIWFIRLLKKDLNLEDGTGITLISDRQKGLLLAVDQELPKVEHRMCARHIYGNLKRAYPGKELPKDLFWAVAKSFNEADYNRATEALKEFDSGVYEAVMNKNPQNCSRAFFTCTSMCEDVSNNFSESYNNAINKAREMPLVKMLETIRRQCMIRNDMRRIKTQKHQGKYSEKVANTIAEEEKYRKYCQAIPCGNGHYEVTEHGHAFRVDMNGKTCACRRWNMTGIPCRHVLRVISLNKKLTPEDFVISDWYLTTKWVSQYSEPLMGVNGMYFWKKSGEARIEPPSREPTKGPTKKQKRMKGKNESPQKKKKGKVMGQEPTQKKLKITREGKSYQCSNCSVMGHNRRKCPTLSPNSRIRTKKPAKKQSEAGPSQQSQVTQATQSSQI